MIRKRDLLKRIEYLEQLIGAIDIADYNDWKVQANANKYAANQQGYFYLNSKTDTQLIEQCIQEINKDPDFAVMLRTADGTVLTLRSYPVKMNKAISTAMQYEGGAE